MFLLIQVSHGTASFVGYTTAHAAEEEGVVMPQQPGGTKAGSVAPVLTVIVLAFGVIGILSTPGTASAYKTTTPWGSPALTYGFLNGTADIEGTKEQQAVRDAMHLWSVVSNVTFTENTANPSLAQIRLKWALGEHGDSSHFDGASNCISKGLTLAHAFFPKESESGDVHFDDDEIWTTNATSPFECQPVDVMAVALHEIGHSLGLEHASSESSTMHENVGDTRRFLNIDDILGVQSLYGYSTGLFHLRAGNSSGPPFTSFRFGTVLGSRSVVGDWDGDGDQTIGFYHPPEDEFYLRNSNDPGVADIDFHWGKSEDKPIAGDWDGDGDQTVGLFRPSNATFYLNDQNENNAAEHTFGFGDPGDVPLAGDWDGDGDDSVGLYRPENKTFYLKNENKEGAADASFVYGTIPLTPVVGDWDDDGDDTVGLYDPSDGDWYLRNFNSTGAAEIFPEYGEGGDVNPIVGDWNGDGETTIGLYQNG